MSHGSVLFEVAKEELQATTAVRKPELLNPTRISVVFYQHRKLVYLSHGQVEHFEEKSQKMEKDSPTTAAVLTKRKSAAGTISSYLSYIHFIFI